MDTGSALVEATARSITARRLTELKNNQVLYQENTEAHIGYRVVHGSVLLYRLDTEGREIGIALVQQGETFGEEMLYDSLPKKRRHNARALGRGVFVDNYKACEADPAEMQRHVLLRVTRLEELWVAENVFERMRLICKWYGSASLKVLDAARLAAVSREMVSKFKRLYPEMPFK